MSKTEKKSILNLLGKEILFFDGGMGSLLQEQGLTPGEFPETWNINHRENILNIHYEYLKAGANILKTNTFGAYLNKFLLDDSDFSLDKIITNGINIAKDAINKIESENNEYSTNNHFIAYDVGPCGKLLEPLGDLSFDKAVELFKTSIIIALKSGIDLILIETMNDIYEAKAAIIASKEAMETCNISVPIFTTTVYDNSGNLLTGSTPEIVASLLESLQIAAYGINCSLGPKQMEPLIPRLVNAASLPVIVNPNAGLPRTENGKTIFDVSPEEFANIVSSFIDLGANILGGCCGTTPKHIEFLVKKCKDKKIILQTQKEHSSICSCNKIVNFTNKPILIGERINPTGKKLFKQALRDNNIQYIIDEGLKQERAGCHILDVNVGLPEIDETKMMGQVIKELQSVTDLPLQIDTTNIETMEKALRLYNGKALINSVNGKQEVMDKVFPLVKKYGGMVVALTLDENGIPDNTEDRINIAKKIISEAKKYGIQKKDLIIDPLAMSISTDTSSGLTTLNAIKKISQELNCKTSLGVSNISFGLPRREIVNATFFTMAMQNGLSAAIMNPLSQDMMNCYKSFCTLSNFDNQCLEYIDYASNLPLQNTTQAVTNSNNSSNIASSSDSKENIFSIDSLQYAVLRGLKEVAQERTKKLLEIKEPLEIIDNELIPTLDIAGKDFENKKIYLPQLLMCAEAAKSSFAVIRDFLISSGKTEKSKGKIILATVKGDIHDIGKNIVKVLLENYSYTVLDLGKDVSPEIIVETCKKENVKLVGLSALMTTTVPAMEETIKALREHCPECKICVGGAVLTQEYADMIGADFYGKDAMDTVRYATTLELS